MKESEWVEFEIIEIISTPINNYAAILIEYLKGRLQPTPKILWKLGDEGFKIYLLHKKQVSNEGGQAIIWEVISL